MKYLGFILFLLLAGPLFAEIDPEIRRIYEDINFLATQLTLDTKPQALAQQIMPVKGTKQHSHKEAQVAEVAVAAAPTPVTRVFSGTNVWGDLTVKILDYGTHMTLQVKSSVGAQGWMLQKGDSSNILFKGNVEGNALNFQIEIPRQYSPDLGLTVIVNSADGQNPAYIALK